MTTRSTQVLVIGAGATGLGIAWDAALRGLDVIVVEQGDLGQGTSGRYHGLLHSGGRYVLSDPPSARDCARENAALRRIAPHTIEPTGGLFLAAPHDPPQYPDRWLAACAACGVPAREITPGEARRREPLLSPRLSRAFEVEDAALDSFELLEALALGVGEAGAEILTRHRLTGLLSHRGGMLARVVPADGEAPFQIEAQVVVNAAGPYVGHVAAMTGVALPVALGKGTMVAMASRLTQTVLNRCKPPSDGDIIVPVGTVCVLGTTDIPVHDPSDLAIEPWEIDLLLGEAKVLLPGIRRHRALRAWAGIRALYRPAEDEAETRTLPRAHLLIDHADRDGIPGFLTVFGGKLTTFRRMAEDTVDALAGDLGAAGPCLTDRTPLPAPSRKHFALSTRSAPLSSRTADPASDEILCECEAIRQDEFRRTVLRVRASDLDDLRRDLRLGMGPCQGAFCTYRAASIVFDLIPEASADGGLSAFAAERWRGLRPLAWGRGLRQLEMVRRIQVELLGAEPWPEPLA
jgi:glycerol-3-phosphate dehydrogenase